MKNHEITTLCTMTRVNGLQPATSATYVEGGNQFGYVIDAGEKAPLRLLITDGDAGYKVKDTVRMVLRQPAAKDRRVYKGTIVGAVALDTGKVRGEVPNRRLSAVVLAPEAADQVEA